MKVGIAGAGLGGLTLALMLRERGIDVELWEAVRELKPLGVGINLLPHAMRELDALGLLDALLELGVETSTLSYFNKHGQRIWEEPRGRAAGYPWPQISIHRGEFQMLLLRVVRERLGPDVVHTGHRAESFELTDECARLILRRPDGSSVEREVDVLVGADGIRSALRKKLYPERDAFQFSGRVMWRAATETQPFMDGRSMFMAGHPDQKFVAYPISERSRRSGRSLVNWIAELRCPRELHDDWNRRVDKSVFAEAFAGWKWDWIDIPALIDGADAVYEFPLVDKNPLPRWSFGRLTLLGDAAHPLYPVGSNGSAQAILDARCLADCLSSGSELSYALREYEAERLPLTTGVLLRNRLHGPEQVMHLAESRAPQGFDRVEDVISRAELEAIAVRYKKAAGFDLSSLVAQKGA